MDPNASLDSSLDASIATATSAAVVPGGARYSTSHYSAHDEVTVSSRVSSLPVDLENRRASPRDSATSAGPLLWRGSSREAMVDQRVLDSFEARTQLPTPRHGGDVTSPLSATGRSSRAASGSSEVGLPPDVTSLSSASKVTSLSSTIRRPSSNGQLAHVLKAAHESDVTLDANTFSDDDVGRGMAVP